MLLEEPYIKAFREIDLASNPSLSARGLGFRAIIVNQLDLFFFSSISHLPGYIEGINYRRFFF